MKKYYQDIFGTFIGGATGWITSGMYHDWIQPMLLAAVCAFIGLLVTHFGKKLFKWLEHPSDKYRSNGRAK